MKAIIKTIIGTLVLMTMVSAEPAYAERVSRDTLREIQEMLIQLGFDPGTPDGLSGRKTRSAIRSYQYKEGIRPADAKPSQGLYDRLQASVKGGSQPASKAPATKSADSATPGKPAQQETKPAVLPPERGVIAATTDLKAKPFSSSDTVKQLSGATEVGIIQSKSGWIEVVEIVSGRPGEQGWVKLVSVKRGASQAQAAGAVETPEESGGFFGGLARSVSGVLGTSTQPQRSAGATSTIGIRGLNAQELVNARPNPAELQKMESYGANRSSADQLAREVGLSKQSVAYLPEPVAAQPATSQSGFSGGGKR